MPASTLPSRRVLRFESAEDILVDCDRVVAGECRLLGNWTLAQIIEHLAHGIDCFYDGFGFQAPWWLRTFAAPLVKRRMLTRGMKSGVQLPETATRLLPTADPVLHVALDHLRVSLARLERDPPTHPHAFLGRMSHEEAKQLMLRHAELHLSFVVPERL